MPPFCTVKCSGSFSRERFKFGYIITYLMNLPSRGSHCLLIIRHVTILVIRERVKLRVLPLCLFILSGTVPSSFSPLLFLLYDATDVTTSLASRRWRTSWLWCTKSRILNRCNKWAFFRVPPSLASGLSFPTLLISASGEEIALPEPKKGLKPKKKMMMMEKWEEKKP